MQIQGELASLNIVIKVNHSYTNVINFKYKCTKNPSQTELALRLCYLKGTASGRESVFAAEKRPRALQATTHRNDEFLLIK